MSNKPWWFPQLAASAEYLSGLRKDYPENAHMSDSELSDYYSGGSKYATTWDHIGDAYDEYKELADAYLKMIEANDSLGAWMSAAMEDPNVCDSMKKDIENWFDSWGKE